MKNNYSQYLFLSMFCLYLLTVLSCAKIPSVTGKGNSNFKLSNNDTIYEGNRTTDADLQAITIPCQNNNTLRIYYSDSAAKLGLPDTLTIVSYGRAGHLRYHECYIEATSSAYDTYLSTGSDHRTVSAGKGIIYINDVILQHFTSTPQSDSVTVDIDLAAP